MYEYEEKSDIIGSPCSLMNPYKGYTEGTIVGDYGNTVVVRLTSGKEIVEFRDEVIIYNWSNDTDSDEIRPMGRARIGWPERQQGLQVARAPQ